MFAEGALVALIFTVSVSSCVPLCFLLNHVTSLVIRGAKRRHFSIAKLQRYTFVMKNTSAIGSMNLVQTLQLEASRPGNQQLNPLPQQKH